MPQEVGIGCVGNYQVKSFYFNAQLRIIEGNALLK
jgi:hypothetical protein